MIPDEINSPDGVLGDIADHVYNNSFVPNRISAYCAAVAFMNLIIGARYKTPDGLSGGLYLGLVGPTGCGKDVAFSAVDDLVHELVKYGGDKNATLNDLEASTIAKASSREGIEDTLSGQAHRKDLLIQLDELGKFAQEGIMGKGEKAKAIATMLTEVYGKRRFVRRKLATQGKGQEGTMKSTVIDDFSITALGATNLESLTNGIMIEQVYDGFLNRFLFFDLEKSMEPGRRKLELQPLAIPTLKKIFKIATRGIKEIEGDTDTKFTFVTYTEEALDRFHEVDNEIRMFEKSTMDRAFKIRVAMHAKKLAICMAVSHKPKKPVITEYIAQRAIEVVLYCNDIMVELLRSNIVDDNMKRIMVSMNELAEKYISAKSGMMASCFYAIPSYALATKAKRLDLDDQFEERYAGDFELVRLKKPGRGRPGAMYCKKNKATRVKKIYALKQNTIQTLKVKVSEGITDKAPYSYE